MKSLIRIIVALALCLALCSCTRADIDNESENSSDSVLSEISTASYTADADISSMNFEFSDHDKDYSYSAVGAVNIILSGNSATVSGAGAAFADNTVKITKEGTYILSGTGKNISVNVAVGDTEKVQLVLNGVTVENSEGPAVYIKGGDKVFVTLASNTKNTLSDGSSYSVNDGDSALDAALYSRSDITFNGTGTLSVTGNYKHAVVSKDDLNITGGTYNITSQKVGLSGKDCVKITGANIKINAGSDGVRSDNSEDPARGFVYLEGGSLDITSGNDGIQAQTLLKIEGGTVKAVSGGGSVNASLKDNGEFNHGWGFGGMDNGASSNDDSESAKGIKSASEIIISGGTLNIDSADDCIHSNGNITISGGNFALASGDDGIHADTALEISKGTVNITKSYEGLEASEITVSGGEIAVTASDDGINAAGGNDSSAFDRPGMGGFSSLTGSIVISGGYTVINASGDGVDSNGTMEVTGGVTLVSGPTNSGNGALDYENSATISGGVFIAVGTVGMAQNFSNAENQGAILTSTSSQSAGKNILIADSSGKVLASFTPAKAYQCAVISAPGIEKGSAYKIVAGATVSGADKNGYAKNTTYSGGNELGEIKMTSFLYGSSGMGGGMGGMNNGGGMRPGSKR